MLGEFSLFTSFFFTSLFNIQQMDVLLFNYPFLFRVINLYLTGKKISRPLSPFSHCVLNSGSQTVGQAPLEGRGATAGVLGSTRGNVRSEAKLN